MPPKRGGPNARFSQDDYGLGDPEKRSAAQVLRWAAAKNCKTREQKPFSCGLRETTEDEGDLVQKLSRTS